MYSIREKLFGVLKNVSERKGVLRPGSVRGAVFVWCLIHMARAGAQWLNEGLGECQLLPGFGRGSWDRREGGQAPLSLPQAVVMDIWRLGLLGAENSSF